MTMNRDKLLLLILAALLIVGVGGFLFLARDDESDGFGRSGRTSTEDGGRGNREVERAQGGSGGGSKDGDGSSASAGGETAAGDYRPLRGGIYGQVHDREGQAIVGAVVALCVDVTSLAGVGRQGDILDHVETDADGRFEFPGLVDTRSYIVRVDKEGFAGKFVPGLQLDAGGRKEVEVTLDEGHVVAGRVTDGSGAPVAGAVIEVRDISVRVLDARLAIERSSTSDAEGNYRVENVAQGFKDISARAPGHATQTRNRVNVNRATVERSFDFVLGPGAQIRGRVVDGEDRGVAEVAIRAQAYDPNGRRMGQALPAVLSDENGVFVYDGLAVDDYILVAEKKGYYAANMRDFGRAGGPDVTIRLKRNPVIRGRVVDAATGAPVHRFDLYSTPRPNLLFVSEAMKQRFDSADGSFEFLCWRNSGDLYLNVAADGYAGGQSVRLDLNGAGIIDEVVIEADRGVQVRGRVVDAKGRGIPDAEVSLEAVLEGEDGLGGLGRMVYAQNKLLARSARSDGNGEFSVDQVRVGAYRLTVRHPSYAPSFGDEVLEFARPGEQRVPDQRLLQGGELSGVVFEDDGSTLRGAVVRLKPEDLGMAMPRSIEATSAEDGSFKLQHVPAGSYRLEVIRTSALHHRMGGLPGAPTAKFILVHVAEGEVKSMEVRGL
ncbi:MAG: carboxypeptidase regulatory-like domain-containing protein [Planctomycetes bacterium]|nr:carboxypeptidase regulatory-like domain-containing protein [Planctomycetota bacterium]